MFRLMMFAPRRPLSQEDVLSLGWMRQVWHDDDTPPSVRQSIVAWHAGSIEERR